MNAVRQPTWKYLIFLFLASSWSFAQESTTTANAAGPNAPRQNSPMVDGPVFSCAETVIEVGTIPITAPPLTNTFIIKNTGTEPLVLQLAESPCECLFHDLDRSTIPPGGQARLTLALNIAGKRGHFWDKIRYNTNDPAKPIVLLGFEGYAYDRVDIEYPDVNFGELDAAALPAFRYPFQAAVYDPSIPELASIHSRRGLLVGEILRSSPGIYQITLSFATVPEEGPFEDILELRFNGNPIPGLPDVGFLDPVTKRPRGTAPQPETYLMHFMGYVRSAIVPLRRMIPISEFLPFTPSSRTFYLQGRTPFRITGIQCDPLFTAKAEPLVYRPPSGTWCQKVVLQVDWARLPAPNPQQIWKIEVKTDDPLSPRLFLYVPDNRRPVDKN